ncbi:MAG: ABC transporter ATP-binding protein [Chloroflexi bacterium]|nr:ABC transporter ATP-binding protein [Chloroflexota bacterium]MCI0579112.1 ABC transporter ATP-binding protein [Chloroflexota bacterium]MCI0643329.1 ABC transporter ATP-binding protein [Chloroflexota bacterium]MCI0728308.1 ABC transporter ATP-binding protein [Chloroflexota bacterium]
MTTGTTPLLDIHDLTVAYRQRNQWLEAVRDFSLQIAPGQTYGLVGESGSGKTTVALAIMRYLSEAGAVREGQIFFNGLDLLSLSPAEMRQVWGRQISLVPQDPSSSLNPSIRVGEQLAEGLRLHLGLATAAARSRAVELLAMVNVPDPPRVAQSYPHQLSGGMQQRVMIAMALGAEPLLLILDEPTTNLDVTTQAAVLDLLQELIRDQHTAALYVTHNLGVVARICDRVAVLYAGELVEDAPTIELFRRPLHPYTQGLLDSIPQLGQNKQLGQLQSIPGRIPPLGSRPPACVFTPRCPLAIDICHQQRPTLDVVDGRRVRCHRWPEIAAGQVSASREVARLPSPTAPSANGETVLTLENVKVHFELRRSLAELLAGQPPPTVKAVDGISLEVERGQTLGLVGESGSGKTTLARTIVGLAERTAGRIELLDISLPATLSERSLKMLRHLQYVFQNPEEALNPYLTVGETLRRPFMTLLGKSRPAADEAAEKLLAAVRLPVEYAGRLPGQLSGGEKQRVAIARAFATNPDLLIADEAVSALDVSVQASILNLLGELQTEHDNTLIFISHDLAVVGYLADQIAVVYLGQLMEVASAGELFKPPYHPYTEALLSAIPLANPEAQQEPIRLEGDVPSQVNVPTGCPFHTRCPRFLGDICVNERPPWRVSESGNRIFCHIPLEELATIQAKAFSLDSRL